jgi:hypothetical protein
MRYFNVHARARSTGGHGGNERHYEPRIVSREMLIDVPPRLQTVEE